MRDTYKYPQKLGNRILHRGMTNDLLKRESEHRQKWSDSHISQVGNKTTRDAALKWERTGGKR